MGDSDASPMVPIEVSALPWYYNKYAFRNDFSLMSYNVSSFLIDYTLKHCRLRWQLRCRSVTEHAQGLGMVVHTYNPSTEKGLWVQALHDLHSQLSMTLSYIRRFLSNKRTNNDLIQLTQNQEVLPWNIRQSGLYRNTPVWYQLNSQVQFFFIWTFLNFITHTSFYKQSYTLLLVGTEWPQLTSLYQTLSHNIIQQEVLPLSIVFEGAGDWTQGLTHDGQFRNCHPLATSYFWSGKSPNCPVWPELVIFLIIGAHGLPH